ncbi:MAG: hypothetical protein IPL27_15220 [Lewinellaceae bacterium]|nr:hypothetical protein [Lewinellaceae bacterium]
MTDFMIPEFKKIDLLHIEAHLGNPQASCAGFGICTVDVLPLEDWIQYRPYHIRRVKAQISKVSDEALAFSFPKNGMLIPTKAHFFMSGTFQVDAPFVLPEKINKLLGLERGIILSGHFPCVREDDCFSFFQTSARINARWLSAMSWRETE